MGHNTKAKTRMYQIYGAGTAITMTNWMFELKTGPLVPLYVPKVYPIDTIESAGISLVPLRYKGQDDNLLKSASENLKAGLPSRALPSYTGTKVGQE
jgi:hypothetical protein